MSFDAIDECLACKYVPPFPVSKGTYVASVILIGCGRFIGCCRFIRILVRGRRSWLGLGAVDDGPDIVDLKRHGYHSLPEIELVRIPFREFDCLDFGGVSIRVVCHDDRTIGKGRVELRMGNEGRLATLVQLMRKWVLVAVDA
jgi:hypothetical protein